MADGKPPKSESTTQLALTLAGEIAYEGSWVLPQQLRWVRDHIVAASPDGKQVLLLSPEPDEPALRTRLKSLEPEKTYTLAWRNLADGRPLRSKRLTYRQEEYWGVIPSRSGDHICTIAEGRVLILSQELETVARFDSRMTNSPSEELHAVSCEFVTETGHLLVLFQHGWWPWEASNALLIHDWKADQPVRVLRIKTYIADATAVRADTVFLIGVEPNWLWRYWVAAVDIRESRPSDIWKVHARETGGQRLVMSRRLLFRAEQGRWFPDDTPLAALIVPPDNLRDFGDVPPHPPYWPFPHPTEEINVVVVGAIRSWQLASGEPGPEFSLKGYSLVWPIAVSPDERWLASRATHFDHFVSGMAFWDDDRFAIFSIDNPDKPVYLSQNLAPKEALLGLAFTPDGSQLIVATNTRLLIYDIKETPEQK